MHTLILVISGLIVLAVFLAAAHFYNRERAGGRIDGARIFIWVWLAASVLNGIVGVVMAGIPVLTEIIVFIVVFGVPAAAAWFVSTRMRETSA